MANSDYNNFFPTTRKTRLPGGYMGKLLRVDMTSGKLTDVNLPEEPSLRKYWGGQLFAEYVLLNELPLAARGKSPNFTKRTGAVRSGDFGSQIVPERGLGSK